MKYPFLSFILLFLAASSPWVQGQLSTLDSFGASPAAGGPDAGLTLQGSVLYGTTSGGGVNGNGNVFSLNTDGSGMTDLYDFANSGEASDSMAELVVSGTTLYGSGYQGGNANYDGVVYAVGTDGTGYTNLHVFSGGADGSGPRGALALASNVLYGVTQFGAGGGGDGTVFAVNTDSTGFTTLFAFSGANGNQPCAGLVLSGNVLYGTTYYGGSGGLGEVYSLTTDGKVLSLLHSFSNADGIKPAGVLVLSGGTLYGTTSAGGSGNGTIFSLGTNGSNFTVLHTFAGGPADGGVPLAGLVLSNNVLFGATSHGGTASGGNGSVFSISTNGTNFSLLYSFTAGIDGGNPSAPLVETGGALYGTALNDGRGQNGTIFNLQLAGVVFAEQPVAATNVPVGTQTTFSYSGFSLSGPDPTVQWRLNGVNIPGATDYILSYANPQLTNGGTVSVAASDGTYAPNSLVALFLVPASIVAAGNDNFANRFALTGTSGTLNGNNTQATKEAGEPQILPTDPGGKSVWFKWTPTTSGIALVTTTGSSFDTIMGVYLGSSAGNLTREPSAISDDDSGGYLTSKIAFNAVAGQEYEIVVDGHMGASGEIVLTWGKAGGGTLPVLLTVPPPLTVTSNGATVTLVCQASSGVPSWYFNGQPTGITATNMVINSLSAANVGVWTAQVATSFGTVTTQPSVLEMNTLEDGTTATNSAALNKFLNSAGTTFVQTSLPVLRRQSGGDTRGFSVSQVFSTAGAAGEPGEPNIAGQIGGSPVWYKYVTPTNGTLGINTAGSSFNTLLGVFTGPGNSFATLTSLGAGYTTNRVLYGQPQITLTNVPGGQTNYIVVDGYQAATGTVHLNIALGNPVTLFTTPSNQFVLAGSNATFSATASGSAPFSYQWQFAGTNIAGATNASLALTNVQQSTTGTYTVLASNLVSAATNSVTLALGTAPGITTQPLSHTVHTNTTASLSVAANGNPAPSYQWLFDGTNAASSGNSVSIPNFAASNQGSYWVVVSNVLGTATSSNAVLLLDSPLRVGAASLSSGAFQLQLIGAAGGSYILETTTNLMTWLSLATNAAPNGLVNLSDTNAANFPHRFYRLVTN